MISWIFHDGCVSFGAIITKHHKLQGLKNLDDSLVALEDISMLSWQRLARDSLPFSWLSEVACHLGVSTTVMVPSSLSLPEHLYSLRTKSCWIRGQSYPVWTCLCTVTPEGILFSESIPFCRCQDLGLLYTSLGDKPQIIKYDFREHTVCVGSSTCK